MPTKSTKRTSGPRYGLLVTFAAMTIAGCGGGGGGGGGGSPPATKIAPSIVTQPAAVTVADGASAQFSITAAGDAPLTYQWRRNGTDLAEGAGVTGATTSKLSLTAPYSYNASQVSVRVTNGAGNVISADATLTVTAVAPTITTQPASTTVEIGAPTTLSATINGGTPPLAYQWKRDGKVVAGATSASYKIEYPEFADNAATFVLEITNPAGTLGTQPAMLTVVPRMTSAVFIVDSTDDLVDADIADGKCLTTANKCSLRAAFMQAGASTGDVTAISVPAGTYNLTLGNLSLSKAANAENDLFITGAGAARTIIDGGQLDNVVEVTGGRYWDIYGLTLRNGQTLDSGGIISNGGVLDISNCVIENGRAYKFGGGIYSPGPLLIYGSTIRSNSAPSGGGLYLTGGGKIVSDSTISGNQAIGGNGGGLYLSGSQNLVVGSTISGNNAALGGGVYNANEVWLRNSTISSNSAVYYGGGVYAAESSPSVSVTTAIYSTSIIGNEVPDSFSGGLGSGVFNSAGSRFITVNALLARNTLRDTPLYKDCYGNLELYGFNLFGDASGCAFSGNNKSWSLISIDKVDPALKDNGGPTLTHAISDGPGSARAFGVPTCVNEYGDPITTDQRGAPRGATCDIGAYQFGAVVP